MRKIIYTTPNGNFCVVHPVRNTHPVPETLSDAEVEARAFAKLPADAINPQFVEADQIPADRSFRNAWKAGSGKVEHDMAKCREIHKDRLREQRKDALAALDVAYMRADEAGNTQLKAQIAAQKQALRDITSDPRIANATTPEELKQVTL